jgi:hypothetical protein
MLDLLKFRQEQEIMVRLAYYLRFVSIAVLEGGCLAGLLAFLCIFLPLTLNGYFLYGLLTGFAFAIIFCFLGAMLGFGLGLILGIVSLYFFPKPQSNKSVYRFVLASVALMMIWPLAYFGLKVIFEFYSATGKTSLDMFSWPVLAAILIGLFVSQRFASRYMKSFSEKAKNSELL